jgi:hypothetical protein
MRGGSVQQPSAHRQHGLGAFGVLVVLALAGGAAYYVYQSVWTAPEKPSCQAQLESCITKCRKTSTDNDAAQVCQAACKKEEADCERFKR